MYKNLLAVLTVVSTALFGLSAAADPMTILVSTKGPGAGNPFYVALEKGARDKAEELGVEVVLLAPPNEASVAIQITQIEDQLAKGIDGLVLIPTDPNAVASIVDEVTSEGVSVVFVDTNGINEGTTYIGTDNEKGASLAAQYICDNVPEGSDVAILTGIITQSTGRARAEGSRAGLEACGLNIVAEQTAEWDRAKGLAVMENILTGNPNLKAVFASNDNMALGAVEALKNADMLEDVLVVGFDANPDAAESILAGDMSATIAQNPYKMGALGVESVVKLAKGEDDLPPVIDTGTVLVTAENADEFK